MFANRIVLPATGHTYLYAIPISMCYRESCQESINKEITLVVITRLIYTCKFWLVNEKDSIHFFFSPLEYIYTCIESFVS